MAMTGLGVTRVGGGATGTDTRPTAETDAQVIEAVVQVGGVETSYLRCGRAGKVVLLLATDDVERARLVRSLGGVYRVIAPMLTGVREPVAWLQGVIDGLGLEDPLVVATSDVARDLVEAAARLASWSDVAG